MVKTEALSDSVFKAFGFDFKIETEFGSSYMGTHEKLNWWVSMSINSITVSFTDKSGRAIWFSLDNKDLCTSGLEASIICKRLIQYMEFVKKGSGKVPRFPKFSVNGRRVYTIWFTQKEV